MRPCRQHDAVSMRWVAGWRAGEGGGYLRDKVIRVGVVSVGVYRVVIGSLTRRVSKHGSHGHRTPGISRWPGVGYIGGYYSGESGR